MYMYADIQVSFFDAESVWISIAISSWEVEDTCT